MKYYVKYCLLLHFLGVTAFCSAQKAEKASAEYTMRVENNMSWEDAVNKAIQYAQVKAIEETFGKVILQDNSTYIKNEQNGDLVKTNSTFSFVSNSYVKGEWVENVDEPKIEKLNRGDETWVKVIVKGRVREITTPVNNFTALPLNCPDQKCKAQIFNDGQDLFVYFKAPEDGYLSIYLTDPSVGYTFLMLPYKHSNIKKCVKIVADKDYIFFSKKHDYFNEVNAIDEQIVSISPGVVSEKYQLWMVFSNEPVEKPVLEDESITTRKFLDETSIKQGYTLQKGISTTSFVDWLQNYRLHNKTVQLASIFLNVNK